MVVYSCVLQKFKEYWEKNTRELQGKENPLRITPNRQEWNRELDRIKRE